MPSAFLITPFSADRAGGEDVGQFASVQAAIGRAAASAGVRLVHPASAQGAGAIMDQVRDEIRRSDVVIAVLAGLNVNVLYELGIARESGRRPALLVVPSPEELPFDLRHERCYTYADRPIEQFEMLLAEGIRQTLAAPPRRGPSQPPLEARTIPPGAGSYLNYRARSVPFLGRDAELERQRAFLGSPDPFRWLSVHGPGGSGKSRMALELALSAASSWIAGFLPPNAFDWRGWSPIWPTLIMIDEAESRAAEVSALLTILSASASTFEWPVRVLLLGRERSQRLEQMLQADPFEWEAGFAPFAAGDPIVLGPLSIDDAQRIVTTLAPDAESEPSLRSDSMRLPLFTILGGVALAETGVSGRWTRTDVARYILDRERKLRWAGCTAQDEQLLAYVTVAKSAPKEGEGDLFPADAALALEHNRIMASHEEGTLLPLEPAPLGELFVLELLGRSADPAAVADPPFRAVAAALRRGIGSDFVLRTMGHYPDHPALPRLIAEMISITDRMVYLPIPLGVPALVDAIPDLVRGGDVALARSVADAVRILELRDDTGDLVGYTGFADALFHLADGLGDHGDIEEALAVARELAAWCDRERRGWDALGKCVCNTVNAALECGVVNGAWELASDLAARALRRAGLAEYAAGAAISGVKAAPSVAAGEALFAQLLPVVVRAGDPDSISSLAKAGFNLTNRAQREGDAGAAIRLHDAILELDDGTGLVPSWLVARVGASASAFAGRMPAASQPALIERFESLASDEDAVESCLIGLHNIVLVDGVADEIRLLAFGALCRVVVAGDGFGIDYCVAAAYKLTSRPHAAGLVTRIRADLAEQVGRYVTTGYLMKKEAQWGVSLKGIAP